MEYTRLENSDLHVSRLCMGGCPMGGYGWGKVQDDDLIAAIHSALDAGVTIFDNADTYGLGKSEEILGKGLGNRRKDVAIATKFGVRVESGATYYDNNPEYIKLACTRSLKRLGTDYIDLYQIHYRDKKTPIQDVIDALEGLKSEGKIRYYGLSNIHKNDIEEIKNHVGSFVSLQDEYSLACRKNEKDLVAMAKQLRLSPLTWGSLGQGILTGKYDKNSVFAQDDRRSREIYVNFHGERLLKNLEIVEVLKNVAAEAGKPISAAAIRFILDFIPESIVIAGIKSQRQLMDNAESMGWKLTKEQIQRLDAISRD